MKARFFNTDNPIVKFNHRSVMKELPIYFTTLITNSVVYCNHFILKISFDICNRFEVMSGSFIPSSR